MRRHLSILILFVLLGFGVSLGVPAEDVPETAYDESEGLPYEDTPLFPVAPLAVARTLESLLSSFHPDIGIQFPVTHPCVHDTDVLRSADARVSLAQLCTLLC